MASIGVYSNKYLSWKTINSHSPPPPRSNNKTRRTFQQGSKVRNSKLSSQNRTSFPKRSTNTHTSISNRPRPIRTESTQHLRSSSRKTSSFHPFEHRWSIIKVRDRPPTSPYLPAASAQSQNTIAWRESVRNRPMSNSWVAVKTEARGNRVSDRLCSRLCRPRTTIEKSSQSTMKSISWIPSPKDIAIWEKTWLP